MILNSFKLDNKVAIVTGGNQGLGMAYSIALAQAGAKLLITAYDENISEVKTAIDELGGEVEFVFGDLTESKVREAAVDKCIEKYGKIDILVNNAGTIRRAPLVEYKDEDYQAVMDININAVYYLSQLVIKHMVKQNSGKVINIASMLSYQGGKFVVPYTVSKHGVVGLTKAFTSELAEYNIQTNAIAPGYIKTENTRPIREDEKRNNEILGRIPTARWGEVEDLMGAVVFLASDASNYVNGHVLAVDGGWLIR